MRQEPRFGRGVALLGGLLVGVGLLLSITDAHAVERLLIPGLVLAALGYGLSGRSQPLRSKSAWAD
jgi:hypothetical protein